jgi:type I restriction enzyme R subunit
MAWCDESLGAAEIASVVAVETLNRIAPNKEAPFVLDFVNKAGDIAEAFQPYYEATVGTHTEPQVLYETWQRIEESNLIEQEDLDAFAAIWFTHSAEQLKGHAGLAASIKHAVDRFDELGEPTQDALRKAINQFVRLYGFLMQVVDYDDPELEKAYPYCRILLRWIGNGSGGALDLSDELELSHLKLAGNDQIAIGLTDGEHVLDGMVGDGAGAMTEEEKALLSDVVSKINERFGTEVTEADRIFFEAVSEQMAADEQLQAQAAVNDRATFKHAFDAKFLESVLDAMEHNTDLAKRMLDDDAYSSLVKEWMLRYVHRRAAERHDKPELDL